MTGVVLGDRMTLEPEHGRSRRIERLSTARIRAICQRLQGNQRLRRTLPDGGRIHIDRQLPFLCVYRRPDDREDLGGHRFVRGSASHLIASGAPPRHAENAELVRGVAETLRAAFGAFLLVELWSAPDGGKANDPAEPEVRPVFRIHAARSSALDRTIEALVGRLRRIKVLKQAVTITVERDGQFAPPAMRPLLTEGDRQSLNCSMLGLEIPPVYRNGDSTEEFPLVSKALRRSIDLALRNAYFQFSRTRTTHRPAHYHELGRRTMVKAVWEVDRRLAEVDDSFEYLLQLTPINTNDAFKEFQRQHFERIPEFHYRPQPIDPGLTQRRLYNIPIERVEDPALQRLFQEKQEELDLKITMLRDRDTPRFLHESLQLFGNVEDDLVALAESLLENTPRQRAEPKSTYLNAKEFSRRANSELKAYRAAIPALHPEAIVTDDVSGLIVSKGRLMINEDLTLPASRIEALIAHEIGTHLLTYCNGKQQPFRQLYSGLAGYEELQEGLAVLSEYLVGGLSRGRVRQLAGRVIAVRNRIEGATFVDTFRALSRTYEFSHRQAYLTTMRAFRGGGLTKDAIYLRGLRQIVRYLHGGGELEPLFVGKIAIEHVPIISELQYRKVLKKPVLRPQHLDSAALGRLARLREGGGTVWDLLPHRVDGSGP